MLDSLQLANRIVDFTMGLFEVHRQSAVLFATSQANLHDVLRNLRSADFRTEVGVTSGGRLRKVWRKVGEGRRMAMELLPGSIDSMV